MSEYDSERLEAIADEHAEKPKQHYTPRPKWQLVFAWVLAAVVFLAFLGTCYWLIFYK